MQYLKNIDMLKTNLFCFGFCYLFVGFHMKTTTYQADRRLKRPAARCGERCVETGWFRLGRNGRNFWSPHFFKIWIRWAKKSWTNFLYLVLILSHTLPKSSAETRFGWSGIFQQRRDLQKGCSDHRRASKHISFWTLCIVGLSCDPMCTWYL